MRRYLVIGIAALALGACGAANGDKDTGSSKPKPTAIETAIDECKVGGFAEVGDDGHTLSVSTDPFNETRQVLKMYCVYGAVEMPDSVVGQVENTTALSGQQEADWDGYEAHWTYHPDNGLGMIIAESE